MNAPDVSATSKTSSPFASWRPSHAGIRVPNFDEAVAWYTTTLDFRLLKIDVDREADLRLSRARDGRRVQLRDPGRPRFCRKAALRGFA